MKLQGFAERVASSEVTSTASKAKADFTTKSAGEVILSATRGKVNSLSGTQRAQIGGDGIISINSVSSSHISGSVSVGTATGAMGGSDIVPFVPKHFPALMQVQAFLGCLLNPGVDGRVGVILSGKY